MNSKYSTLYILCTVVLSLVIIFIGHYFWQQKNETIVASSKKDAPELIKNTIEYKDFYQKIRDKENLNYLIIGDSIGQSSGTGDKEYFWFIQLNEKLKKEYNINHITTKKLTAGGATSFDGFIKYAPSGIVKLYDLVFISFGQNDVNVMNPEEFGIFYENIIREIKEKHPKAEIVTLIESSLKGEEYPDIIKKISNRHNTILVDTRIPFYNSGKTNDELTVDTIHPTNEGYTLYANQIFNILKKSIESNKKPAQFNKNPLYPGFQYEKIKKPSVFPVIEGFSGYSYGQKSYLKGEVRGSYLEAEFEGSLIGFTILGTDDSGIINVYIDNELVLEVNPYTPEPREKHIYVANDLEDSKHKIKLEVSGKPGYDYKGNPIEGTTTIISNLITSK